MSVLKVVEILGNSTESFEVVGWFDKVSQNRSTCFWWCLTFLECSYHFSPTTQWPLDQRPVQIFYKTAPQP